MRAFILRGLVLGGLGIGLPLQVMTTTNLKVLFILIRLQGGIDGE